jgi:flagellar motor switch protein FliM
MFGGDGKSIPQIREFTKIEQRMIGKFAAEVLKHLEKAWSTVFTVNLTLRKSETKSEFVHLVSPNELVIVIAFSIGGNGFSGNIYFCISYLMLEPIKDRLSSQYLRERDLAHSWNEQLQNLLRDTEVNLIAELGRARLNVRDILNLRVQDVIKLNTGPQDLITIHVEEMPKYRGFPGVVKGNRAIQITTMMRQNGGTKSHDPVRRK